MKYVGSKNRYAKEILPIILRDRAENQYYVEPFVGGFNIIDKVGGKRIANDIHFYLIELYRAIQAGWQPPNTITEKEWYYIKYHMDEFDPCLVGFVGFGCSFSGKWFGGYARGDTNAGIPRNYCLESKKNILKQYDGIQGINIFNGLYWNVEIPDNSIVYCDPPYANSQKYSNNFDHIGFWKWCEELVDAGHKVFVSEYIAPQDWNCVWSKTVHNTLDLNTGAKTGTEKLFVHESQL